jgi:integrase
MGRRNDQGERARTLAELSRAFLSHANTYYRRADGTPTREASNFVAPLEWFNRVAGEQLAPRDITTRDIKQFRRELINAGHCRTTINAYVAKVRRAIKWAVEAERISVEDGVAALGVFAAVGPLRRGRSEAAEKPRVDAIDVAHVRALMPYMSRDSRDVVEVLLRTGARVGEIVSLRRGDLDRDDDGQWWAMPTHHKTAHHGHRRYIPLDADCVRIINQRVRLDQPALFEEASREYVFGSRRKRGTHLTPNAIVTSLERARLRAKAKGVSVPRWHVHQIRHSVATVARRAGASLDDLQGLLGHASQRMTEVYARPDFPRGARRAQLLALKGVA